MTLANRRTTLLLSRCIILMLLFAQSLYAAQPCKLLVHEPARAVADMPDCHKKPTTQNACLQQCTLGNQSSAQIEIVVAPMPALAVLSVPVTPDSGAGLAIPRATLARSPDPPSSIRFCSLQI
jgi:hypothetical protein